MFLAQIQSKLMGLLLHLPGERGQAFTSPGLEIFHTILNWGIKRYSALDYCAPEKLWATEANGQLGSQTPLLLGARCVPPKGSGTDHDLHSQTFQKAPTG